MTCWNWLLFCCLLVTLAPTARGEAKSVSLLSASEKEWNPRSLELRFQLQDATLKEVRTHELDDLRVFHGEEPEGSVRLWVNGKEVHANRMRAEKVDTVVVPTQLRDGLNVIKLRTRFGDDADGYVGDFVLFAGDQTLPIEITHMGGRPYAGADLKLRYFAEGREFSVTAKADRGGRAEFRHLATQGRLQLEARGSRERLMESKLVDWTQQRGVLAIGLKGYEWLQPVELSQPEERPLPFPISREAKPSKRQSTK